jgi:hypothetical protein
MNDPTVTVAMRIPGKWAHPKELVERLPKDCQLTGDTLILPDSTAIDFDVMKADHQFPQIFRTSCRRPPTPQESAAVNSYAVNVLLSGPGGSMQAAQKMMEAGAAIVRAGGAGVFIDNCALAHGGASWLEMTEDGSSDALSFAFVGIVRGRTDLRTIGMHILGLRDLVMSRADVEKEGFDIVEVIRYVCAGEKPVEDGHIIADLNREPRFRASAQESGEPANSPMYNPFGCLKLVSFKDIAENN